MVPVPLENISLRVNIAKALVSIIAVENPHIVPCFVSYGRHEVINIFRHLMNFEPIISPVNRDVLFD